MSDSNLYNHFFVKFDTTLPFGGKGKPSPSIYGFCNSLFHRRKFSNGQVGKGVAAGLRGLGAQVAVVETDPVCALQACLDGLRVGRLEAWCERADLLVTCTGCRGVVRREHVERLRRGCLLVNMGHGDTEIDVAALRLVPELAWERVRPQVDHISWPDGRFVVLLAEVD